MVQIFQTIIRKLREKEITIRIISFKTIYIGLEAPREVVYDRINQRVDQMITDGLIEEAKSLFIHKNKNALLCPGSDLPPTP